MVLSPTYNKSHVHNQISLKLIEYVEKRQRLIDEAANILGIKPRDLELQVLLYLPRLMDDNYCLADEIFTQEINRLTSLIQERITHFAEWRESPALPPTHPRETYFTEVAEREARIIHKRFHYLSSFRPASWSFGLRTFREDRLAGLLTLSPFDLDYITPYLPPEVDASNVLVVSRVFCFDWAPKDAVSYMMGQIYKRIRFEKPEVKMLLTYINPNLAFYGSSLKASNWVFFGYEWGTRYAYIDKQYITDRELVRLHKIADPYLLKRSLGDRFEVSQVALDPLHLYAYFVDKELYLRYTEGFQHEFERP